jgi:hypothetical protein
MSLRAVPNEKATTELLANSVAAPSATKREAPACRAITNSVATLALLTTQLVSRATKNGRSPTSSMTEPSTRAQ